jgi:hypothetical protein
MHRDIVAFELKERNRQSLTHALKQLEDHVTAKSQLSLSSAVGQAVVWEKLTWGAAKRGDRRLHLDQS